MRLILAILIVSAVFVMKSAHHENPVLAKESLQVQSTQTYELDRTDDDFQIHFSIPREVVLAIIIIVGVNLVVFVVFMIITGAILG